MNAVFQGLVEAYLAQSDENRTEQQGSLGPMPPQARSHEASSLKGAGESLSAQQPRTWTREAILRAYVGWMPGVVLVKEVHSRIICANERFFELIGRRDVVGQLPTEYFDRHTGELVMVHDHEVFEGKCALLCVERISVNNVPQQRIAIRFPIRDKARIELTGALGFDQEFLTAAAKLNPNESGTRACRLPSDHARAIEFSDTFNSSTLLDAFVESLPAIAVVKDLAGRLLYANGEYTEVTGKQREEAIGRLTRENWPGAIGHVIMAHDQLVRETQVPFLSVETLPVGAGAVDRLNLRFPIFDADGALALTGSIGFDYENIRQGLTLKVGTFDFCPLQRRVA